MSCSWNRTSQKFSRAALLGAAALLVMIPTTPAWAQYSCQPQWVTTLLDTSETCVNEPWRERAMGVQSIRWKGHDYIIFNRGNELSIYNIDNPTAPLSVAKSEYRFGTRGDSDYDLLDFDVCDDCRYGVFAHKVKGTVVFDLGSGSEPYLAAGGYWAKNPGDAFAGGSTFQKDGQQYLVLSTFPEHCGMFGTGLYMTNGLSTPNFVECVEVGGASVFIKGMHPYTVGTTLYLYASDVGGQTHVFRADGAGAGLTLTHLSSPSLMTARQYTLSIDANNARAASGRADNGDGEVTIWDLSSPTSPQALFSVPGETNIVSLSSPSANADATMFTAYGGDFGSERSYTVGSGGPLEFAGGDPSFWGDRTLAHNELPGCGVPVSSAISPDGSVLYLSRNVMLQVFDLSACLSPVEATAALTLTPSSVYPGETVTISDASTGQVDRRAIWVTEEPGSVVAAGSTVPTAGTLLPLAFQIPPDVAAGTSYQAHIKVESDTLTPAVPSADVSIGIDRAPTANIAVDPAAVIVGETVNLQATVSGGSPSSYQWEIWAPGATTPDTRTGPTVASLLLPLAGEWIFKVAATYAHEASSGGPYVANYQLAFDVTSVAADFSISPPSPLHTQVITLDGSISKPIGGSLSFAWKVESLFHDYNGCNALPQCVIPANSLNPNTTYTITLTVTNNADQESDEEPRQLFVGDGNINPTISFSPSSPDIGQNTVFTINGVTGDIDSASWSMGGPGCDGADSTPECTPNLWHDCKTLSYKYSTSGTKTVNVSLVIGGNTFTAPARTLTVDPSGSCSGPAPPPPPTCTFTLGDSEQLFGPYGGTDAFSITTSFGCSWTATTSSSWITLQPPTSGTGSGTVRYSVAVNEGRARTGTIIAANKIFVVSQEAKFVPANFTMSKPNPEIGEVMTFTVDPLLEVVSWDFGEADCRGNSPNINCAYLPSGTCNNMQWTYPTSGQKSITMVLADTRTQTKFPTVQPVGECCLADGRPDAGFTMSASEINAGDTVYFSDTSSKAFQNKAAVVSWAPTSPEIGDTIVFSLGGVVGDIELASWDFGGDGCEGGSTATCVPSLWDDCTAISFAYASGGQKSVSVSLQMAGGGTENAGPVTVNVADSGTCDDGGGGGGCSYALSQYNVTFQPEGGSGSFNVDTTDECAWNATTTFSWLTVDSDAGTGPGTVTYTVAANEGLSPRIANIRVEGEVHKVTQLADEGDTAPSAWAWTVTRIEDDDGNVVNEIVGSGNTQDFSFRFDDPGVYQVMLVASNCLGSDTTVQYVTVGEALVEEFVVGAAVRAVGDAGTSWVSDFRFFNPCDEEIDVQIEYEPGETNNVGKALANSSFRLVPNETVKYADVAEAIQSLDSEETLSGSMRVDSQSDSGCKVLTVSRTFNDTAQGSLGVFVPTIPVRPSLMDYLDLTGLVSNANFRTNVRLVNYGDEDATVKIKIFDHAGDRIGEEPLITVPAHSTDQINNVPNRLRIGDDLDLFSVRVETFGHDVDVFGTVIDQLTGDAVVVMPTFSGDNRIWLVGVANLTGENARWRSDVWISNPTDDWLAGRAEFVIGSNPDELEIYHLDWPVLNPHRSKEFSDIVAEQWGLEDTRGFLEFIGENDTPSPLVTARTFDLDLEGGSYGLGIRTFTEDDLLDAGHSGYIVGVSTSDDPSQGFHTNLHVLNTDHTEWSNVRITIYAVDGSEAAAPWSLLVGPRVYKLWEIFGKLGIDSSMIGTIKVEVLDGGSVAAFATEIDNKNQDSIFVPAQRRYMGLAR